MGTTENDSEAVSKLASKLNEKISHMILRKHGFARTDLTKGLAALGTLVIPLAIVANTYVLHKILDVPTRFNPFVAHKN
jgi:hypothetical protein